VGTPVFNRVVERPLEEVLRVESRFQGTSGQRQDTICDIESGEEELMARRPGLATQMAGDKQRTRGWHR
jgi:hypothetical protein